MGEPRPSLLKSVMRTVSGDALGRSVTLPPSTGGIESSHHVPREHLFALDLARILTVSLVISVHTLALGAGHISVPVGAFITVFHTSREVFFLITAFALTYTYGRRKVRWVSFWRRRYSLLLPAYVTWTVVYFFADRKRLDPISSAVTELAHDLLTGQARYHLYFLIVSMQIYLLFPVLRWLLRRTDGHHLALFVGFGLYEFALTYAIHYQHGSFGVLSVWLNNPDALLPSYLFYIVTGGLVAWHLDTFVSFTRRHMAVVVTTFWFGVACGVGSYLMEVRLAGQSPSTASAVYQPAIVVESIAIAWAFFAAGQRWADRGTPHRRLVSAGADCSFGIFLCHPLLLQGLLALGGATGVLAAIRRGPVGGEIAIVLVIGVPFIYGTCGVVIELFRRTRVSLLLTGRARSTGASSSNAANHESDGPGRERAEAPSLPDVATSPLQAPNRSGVS